MGTLERLCGIRNRGSSLDSSHSRWCSSGPEELSELFRVGWTMVGAKRHPGSGCSRQSTHFMEKTKIEVDFELAQRFQTEEQEQLTDDKKAKLFMEFLEKRRKFIAAKRAEKKRNRPPTKSQQRSLMCTYLKYIDGWKPRDLKNKYFAKIKELFNKAMARINNFVDFRTELVEESLKKAVQKEQEMSWSKKVLKSISIKAASFESLYGRKCRSPVCWAKAGEAQLLGPEIVQKKTEKIIQIKQRIQVARDRQKSYADLKHKPMEFQVGDRVMLQVSPCKGVIHFGKRGKLNPIYVGPFKVLEKVGFVTYKLKLPQELSRVHNTFHVSNFKKCYADEPLSVSLDGLRFDDKLHFIEEPIEIIDREVKRLKRNRIPIVKVRWNSRRGPEFTWERKDQFRKKYPHLFTKTAPSSSTAS
nr:putative reverse transcriptase domain-containing protein [Tanacetum cinerariifolium]